MRIYYYKATGHFPMGSGEASREGYSRSRIIGLHFPAHFPSLWNSYLSKL